MRLPGVVGALVEKDLRVAWRDPRLKALVFSGVIGPLVLLLLLGQGSTARSGPGLLLAVASFAGLGALGSQRVRPRAPGPGACCSASRWTASPLLVAKNLGVVVLRLPALLSRCRPPPW